MCELVAGGYTQQWDGGPIDQVPDEYARELGHLHLLLTAARAEVDFIRDRVDLIVAARVADMRTTITDQAALVDDRDRYIRQLEASVAELRDENRALLTELERCAQKRSALQSGSGAAKALLDRLRQRSHP